MIDIIKECNRAAVLGGTFRCNREDIPDTFWPVSFASRKNRKDIPSLFKVIVPNLDRRTVSEATIRENAKFADVWQSRWFTEGTGHCEIDGRAQRYIGETSLYLAYIPDLNALKEFMAEHGRIVVDIDNDITVYDDYLE